MGDNSDQSENVEDKNWVIAIQLADCILDKALLLLCLLLLLIGSYCIYDDLLIYDRAGNQMIAAYRPKQGEKIEPRRTIEGEVAWIMFEDTGIDYPVMQGETNSEYLNKDPYGDFSLSGSIFLDAANSSDFSDPYSMIYGHHMEHGFMFGALDAFAEEPYFINHREGELITTDGREQIHLFAVLYDDAASPRIFEIGSADNEEIIRHAREQALYFEEPEKTERLLALSTCSGEEGQRLILLGYLEEKDEEIP